VKAIVFQRYGPPEVLHVTDMPRPTPDDDQVLIRVHAAEVTKADCELRSFRFAVKWFWLPLRIAFGVFKPRRPILGLYFAGVVVETGAAVRRVTVGEEVFGSAGMKMGAYGEYMVVPANTTVVPKPEKMSFAEAAAVPLGGLNALHFLRLAAIEPGESVLVNGAGGSIGLHAVQIAKAMGAEVTAVDKPLKEALIRRMGADHFVDYTARHFADTESRFDVIVDMVPTSDFNDCMNALKDNGRYFNGNPKLATMVRCWWTTRFSDRTASCAFARETREELLELKAMIERGELRSIMDEVLPMEQIAEAHHKVEQETRLGAIVVSIADQVGFSRLNVR
jgi:NADPH:quinone reductase-like Zn-dependent oxidoreductase